MQSHHINATRSAETMQVQRSAGCTLQLQATGCTIALGTELPLSGRERDGPNFV